MSPLLEKVDILSPFKLFQKDSYATKLLDGDIVEHLQSINTRKQSFKHWRINS